MNGQKLLAFLILIFFPNVIWGNIYDHHYDEELHATPFGVEDGLSYGSVLSFLRDSDDYIWIGTDNGLNRFDGYEFEIFRHEHNNKDSIVSGHYITAILEDSNKGIWVAHSFGLSYFNKKNGTFTNYTEAKGSSTSQVKTQDEAQGITIGQVKSMEKASDGNIYFISEKGFFVYSQTEGQVFTFEHYSNTPLNDRFLDTDISKNTIWLSSKNCIYSYDYINNKITDHCKNNNQIRLLSKKTNFSTITYHDNSLVIGGTKGLFFLDVNTYQWHSIQVVNDTGICSNTINDIVIDNNNGIWLATSEGLSYSQNGEQGSFRCYKSSVIEPKASLISDNIQTIYIDNTGLVWVGDVYSGFSITDANPKKVSELSIFDSHTASNKNLIVTGFAKDDDNTLWVASSSHFFSNFNLNTHDILPSKHQKIISKLYDSVEDKEVFSMVFDYNKRLWISLAYNVFVIDTNNNKTIPVKFYLNGELYTFGKSSYLYENKKGEIIFYTSDGVFEIEKISPGSKGIKVYLKSEGNVFLQINELADGIISDIEETIDGDIWVGTSQGLMYYSKKESSWSHYKYDIENPLSLSDNRVHDVFIDSKTNIWVATFNGLNKIIKGPKPDQFYFQRITKEDGLPTNTIASIIEDFSGTLWIGTTSGLVRYSEFDESMDLFEKNDGLSSIEFVNKSVFLDESGKIYLGTTNGITVINVESEKRQKRKRGLKFTNIEIGGERLLDTYQLNQIKTPEISVREDEKILKVSVSDLYYRKIGSITYRYRMNVSNDWKYLDKNWTITFAGLPEGEYLLDIQSKVTRESWPTESLQLKVNVKHNFFESKKATYLIILLAFASCIFLVYFTRRYYLKSTLLLKNRIKIEKLRLKESKNDNAILSNELQEKQDNLKQLTEKLTKTSLQLEEQQFKDPVTQLFYFESLEKIVRQPLYHRNFSLSSNTILFIQQLEKENLQKQYGFVAPSDICSHISEILKLSLPSNAQIFLSEMVDFMVFVNTSDYEIFLTSLKSVIEKIEFSQIPVGNKRSYKPQLLISIMQLNNARPARASELFDLSQSLIKFHNGKKHVDKILQISLDPLTKDDYAKLDFEELQKKGLLNYNFLDKRGSYE
jgi:ligand-binding sensor domain-containing protein